MEYKKVGANYAAIYNMSQTQGWQEIEKILNRDDAFFTKLIKTRKPAQADINNKIVRGEFLTCLHDLGHARGALEVIEKILNVVKKSVREVSKK